MVGGIYPPDLHLHKANASDTEFPLLVLHLSISKGYAMVLDKLPGPGRPPSLDKSRARAYCTCSRCGWGLFEHFYSHLSFLFSFSLSLGDDPI